MGEEKDVYTMKNNILEKIANIPNKDFLDYISAVIYKWEDENGIKILWRPFFSSKVQKEYRGRDVVSIKITPSEPIKNGIRTNIILIDSNGIHYDVGVLLKNIISFDDFEFNYIEKTERKMSITIDGVDMSYAIAIKGILEYMQTLGNIGSSRSVSLFVDGDGSFRPKITVDYPVKIPDFDVKQYIKKNGDMFIDPDSIAWKIYH